MTYADIRKQTIWGNKFIAFHKKPIIFENWIKSDIIYLNDILDDTMSLSENYILNKLKCKVNWIVEFHKLKQSIPQNWIDIVKQENSVQSKLNIQRNKITWNDRYFETTFFSNKMLYDSLVKSKKETSAGLNRWLKILTLQEA